MKQTVWELYDKSEIASLRKKRGGWIAAAIVILLVGLSLCIGACLLTRPRNATQMLTFAVAVSVLTGWILLSILHFAIAELNHVEKHAALMLSGEREVMDGPFTLTNEYVRVKNGVTMVRLCGAAPGSGVMVFAQKAKLLRGKQITRVWVVYGFAVAYEASPTEGGAVCG